MQAVRKAFEVSGRYFIAQRFIDHPDLTASRGHSQATIGHDLKCASLEHFTRRCFESGDAIEVVFFGISR